MRVVHITKRDADEPKATGQVLEIYGAGRKDLAEMNFSKESSAYINVARNVSSFFRANNELPQWCVITPGLFIIYTDEAVRG